MSLSNLFEFKEPQDLLKGLLSTLNEWDQSKDKEDTGEKTKMVNRTTWVLSIADLYFSRDCSG